MRVVCVCAIGITITTAGTSAFALAPYQPKDEALRNELKCLEGTWQLVSVISWGNPLPFDEFRHDMSFKDGELEQIFTAPAARGKRNKVGFRLYLNTTPKGIDLISTEGKKTDTARCIYRLDNDTLTVCFLGGGDVRPTKFESTAANAGSILTFKRTKR